jgi:hypothetical protein
VKISVKKIPKDKSLRESSSSHNETKKKAVATPAPPVRQDIRTIQKKVSIYTSSEEDEEEKLPRTVSKLPREGGVTTVVASTSPAAAGLHPNAKHGVEILGWFFFQNRLKSPLFINELVR